MWTISFEKQTVQDQRKKVTCNETKCKSSNKKKNMCSQFFWDGFIRYQYRIFCNFLQLSPNNDDICTYKDAVYNIVFPVYTISTRLRCQALKYAHGNKTYLSYRHILFKQTFSTFYARSEIRAPIKSMYALVCDKFCKWMS